MPTPLVLSELTPLKTGNLRDVYQHPQQPALLVKIVRPDAIARRWDNAGWFKRLPRARHYGGFVRELKEYIALRAQAPREVAPIAHMLGIVDTDLGLGLVSEKIVGADGAMAPSLHALCRANGGVAPAWTVAALDTLYAELLRFNVIVGDLHAGNIVHGSDSRGGAPRFFLVDGFGETNFVPLNSMSRWRNARHTLHQFRRLQRELVQLQGEG
jgi:hypothetical protein